MPSRWNGRAAGRPMPLPRSLAHLKREIAEKKWTEARRWVEVRFTGKKYKLPSRRHLDGMVEGSRKGLVSRFYQLQTGHAMTGQYLKRTTNLPSAKCGWRQYGCRPANTTSRGA
jgi:hypothetical protein